MSKWQSIGFPRSVIAQMPDESHSFKGFKKGPLRVLISVDHGRHHMSISCADRNPTWEEIKEARYELLPLGKHFVMALPPPQHYVNQHPFTFHLWECLPEREKDLIWTIEQG